MCLIEDVLFFAQRFALKHAPVGLTFTEKSYKTRLSYLFLLLRAFLRAARTIREKKCAVKSRTMILIAFSTPGWLAWAGQQQLLNLDENNIAFTKTFSTCRYGHKEQKRGEAIFELRGKKYRPSVAATENDCCFICYIDDLYISPCESSATVK